MRATVSSGAGLKAESSANRKLSCRLGLEAGYIYADSLRSETNPSCKPTRLRWKDGLRARFRELGCTIPDYGKDDTPHCVSTQHFRDRY
jgi:hypothetical protein